MFSVHEELNDIMVIMSNIYMIKMLMLIMTAKMITAIIVIILLLIN